MDRVSLRVRIKRVLMIPQGWIASLLAQQSTARASRSTILGPLAWMLSISATATLGGVYSNAPLWILAFFLSIAGLTALLFLATYVYCLLWNKADLLRSETYSIQKLAIEKGFRGDSIVGTYPVETTTSPDVEVVDSRDTPREQQQ